MKFIKILVVLSIILIALGFVGIGMISVDVVEDSLPTNVYEEDADLLTIVNTRLFDLFVTGVTNEYTVVEEVINLIILDSIRENINSEYDPLGDCDTSECNFIIYEDNYYVNYIWAELNSDNQLVVNVSLGTEKLVGFNTIFDFVFDIEIDYLGLGIELTLDSYHINDHNLSISILDSIFGALDKEQIESDISKGELDLDDYSYSLSFTPIS